MHNHVTTANLSQLCGAIPTSPKHRVLDNLSCRFFALPLLVLKFFNNQYEALMVVACQRGRVTELPSKPIRSPGLF